MFKWKCMDFTWQNEILFALTYRGRQNSFLNLRLGSGCWIFYLLPVMLDKFPVCSFCCMQEWGVLNDISKTCSVLCVTLTLQWFKAYQKIVRCSFWRGRKREICLHGPHAWPEVLLNAHSPNFIVFFPVFPWKNVSL